MISKYSILVFLISIPIILTKKIIIIICKKNLELTLLSFFVSERKPIKKIENKKKK